MANFLTPGKTWWVSVAVALVVGAGGAVAATSMGGGEDPCAAVQAAGADAGTKYRAAVAEWEAKKRTTGEYAAQVAMETANRFWAQITSDNPACFSPASVAAARQYLAEPRR